MSKKFYVYSTLTGDVQYTNFRQGGGDIPVAEVAVTIQGGAGVANDRFVTPRGVVTTVTEEQVEHLRANKVFQLHEQNGFVQISEAQVDPDKAAADMTGRDDSAPLVPQDMAKEEDIPEVGAHAEEDAAPTTTTRRRR